MNNKLFGNNLFNDYLMITLGLLIYSVGYTCFLLPYQIVSGGVAGIATLVYYSTGLYPSYTNLAINAILLFIAIYIMGWRYLTRTLYATILIPIFISIFQQMLTMTAPDGTETIQRILGEQQFMACTIGGLMEGLGLATVFLAGGSTGGTDIIASCVNKYREISLGRILLYIDIIIVGCSFFISHSVQTVVVGYISMLIGMNFLDYVINAARQSVQFIIISEKNEEIAREVDSKVGRGITVLYGEGWYSKEQRRVLLIMAKKYESRHIFSLIRQLDPRAFVTMTNVEGVFGEGFDVIKKQ